LACQPRPQEAQPSNQRGGLRWKNTSSKYRPYKLMKAN
jgi:hypothetical protein